MWFSQCLSKCQTFDCGRFSVLRGTMASLVLAGKVSVISQVSLITGHKVLFSVGFSFLFPTRWMIRAQFATITSRGVARWMACVNDCVFICIYSMILLVCVLVFQAGLQYSNSDFGMSVGDRNVSEHLFPQTRPY